jgi:hypothetical protein
MTLVGFSHRWSQLWTTYSFKSYNYMRNETQIIHHVNTISNTAMWFQGDSSIAHVTITTWVRRVVHQEPRSDRDGGTTGASSWAYDQLRTSSPWSGKITSKSVASPPSHWHRRQRSSISWTTLYEWVKGDKYTWHGPFSPDRRYRLVSLCLWAPTQPGKNTRLTARSRDTLWRSVLISPFRRLQTELIPSMRCAGARRWERGWAPTHHCSLQT